jgi:hypothetical protein
VLGVCKGLVEGGEEGGIAKVLEHVGDLAGGDSREGERGKAIFGEELGARGLVAVSGSAATEFGEEEELIGMKGVGRVALNVAIVKGGKLGDVNFVAGFFADFASGSNRGGLPRICPAARQGPAAILEFANKEDSVVAKCGDPNVYLGSGIAGLMGKKVVDWGRIAERCPGGHHFRGNGAKFLVALDVELVLAIREAGLRDRLQPTRPGEPRRRGHAGIVA